MNIKKIEQLVQDEFGEVPVSVTHMPFGHGSVTYDVQLSDPNIMLRTNANPRAFENTAHNISRLRELGLPVPKLHKVSVGTEQYGFAFMILEKIPGRDLRYELPTMNHDQMEVLADQIVAFERKVGSVLPSGKGFGYASIGAKAAFSDWPAMLRHEVVQKDSGTDEYCIALKKEIIGFTHSLEPELLKVRADCFLDDLTTKNVIMLDGELQGLIDFDVVCYGDPLWWISLAAIAVVADLGFERLSYVDMLIQKWGISDRQRVHLALYQLLHGLAFLIRLKDNSQEWRERMQQHLDRQLTIVRGSI